MNKRILLADDSLTIQKVVELTFMEEDFEVDSVGSGDEAIALLERSLPSLVIADVHMPGASGYEVCRRAKEADGNLPVLLLVGTFEALDEDEVAACGADGHLKKPFDSQELLQIVQQMTGGDAQVAAEDEAKPEGFEPTVHDELTAHDLPGEEVEEPAAGDETPSAVGFDFGERVFDDEPEVATFEAEPEVVAADLDDLGPAGAAIDFEQPPESAESASGLEGRLPDELDLTDSEPDEPRPLEALLDDSGLDDSGLEDTSLDDWGLDDSSLGDSTSDDQISDDSPVVDSGLDAQISDDPPEVDSSLDEGPLDDFRLEGRDAASTTDEPAATDSDLDAVFGEDDSVPLPVAVPREEPAADERGLVEEDADEPEPRPHLAAVEEPAWEVAVEEPASVDPIPQPEELEPPLDAAGPADAEPGLSDVEGLSDEDVDRVARRVVELMSDDTVREVAWDVIPDLAEIVIKDRIRELEDEAD